MDETPVVAADPVVLSLEQIGPINAVRLWSCGVTCRDRRKRNALGVYIGDLALFLSRPWLVPADAAVHRIVLRETFPLFSALIQAADYHVVDGVAYGEIAPTMIALSALSGIQSRNTLYRHLSNLHDKGYILYEKMKRPQSAAFIRIYPTNHLTGQPIFEMGPEWRREFVTWVTPQTCSYYVTGSAKHFKVARVHRYEPASHLFGALCEAPILMPKVATIDPMDGAVAVDTEFAAKLANVGGLDDIFRAQSGLHPDLGPADVGENPQDQSLVQSYYQDGWLVQVGPETMAPEVGRSTEHQQSYSEANGQPLLRDSSVSTLTVCASTPNNGVSSRSGACGAPAAAPSAPPPGLPPVASALFLRPICQRKLRLGQVAALHRTRGPRQLGEVQPLTKSQLRCIETYERLIGVPFCSGDLPHLEAALSGRPVRLVENAIKYCAKGPASNPGYYVYRDGMAAILKVVKSLWVAAKKRNAASSILTFEQVIAGPDRAAGERVV